MIRQVVNLYTGGSGEIAVMRRVYILGGYQSDFAENWARHNSEVGDVFSKTLKRGLEETALDYADLEVGSIARKYSPVPRPLSQVWA